MSRTFTDEDSAADKGGTLNTFSGDAEKVKVDVKTDEGASNEEYWTTLLQVKPLSWYK